MKNKAKMLFTVAALSGSIAGCLLLWLFIAQEKFFRPGNPERLLKEKAVVKAVQKSRAVRELLGEVPKKIGVLAQTAVRTDPSGQGWMLVKCYTATPQGEHDQELDHRILILRFNVRKAGGADWSWQIDDQVDCQILDCFVLFRARLVNFDDGQHNEENFSSDPLDVDRQAEDTMARSKRQVLDQIWESRHALQADDPNNDPCPYLEDHPEWLNRIRTQPNQAELVVENREGVAYAQPAQLEKLIMEGANVLVAWETKRETSSGHAAKVIVKLLN
jgi:hypothetical protein